MRDYFVVTFRSMLDVPNLGHYIITYSDEEMEYDRRKFGPHNSYWW